MAQIHHKVGIAASAATVYQALTSDAGLAGWWSSETSGAGAVGSTITFQFNAAKIQFRVRKLKDSALVEWTCVASPADDWIDTFIRFQLDDDGKQTTLRFWHGNWPDAPDFMAHCNTKWAVFLLSLKDLLETGKGKPFPNDIQIDHN